MQSTLDMQNTNHAEKVDVTFNKSTLILSDDHLDYLYRTTSPEFKLKQQIEDHELQEKAEMEELKDEFEYLQQFKEFRPKSEIIRVGKHNDKN